MGAWAGWFILLKAFQEIHLQAAVFFPWMKYTIHCSYTAEDDEHLFDGRSIC